MSVEGADGEAAEPTTDHDEPIEASEIRGEVRTPHAGAVLESDTDDIPDLQVDLWSNVGGICLAIEATDRDRDLYTGTTAKLTSEEARRLASKLHRIADLKE
ncbi:hypothetical protein JCM17823_14620 [Halorubrum gandharaense]